MISFRRGYIEKQPIPQRLLKSVCLLGEFRGKEALFERQTPQALETLRRAAAIPSTESLIRVVLNRLMTEDAVGYEGAGRAARWRKRDN